MEKKFIQSLGRAMDILEYLALNLEKMNECKKNIMKF